MGLAFWSRASAQSGARFTGHMPHCRTHRLSFSVDSFELWGALGRQGLRLGEGQPGFLLKSSRACFETLKEYARCTRRLDRSSKGGARYRLQSL